MEDATQTAVRRFGHVGGRTFLIVMTAGAAICGLIGLMYLLIFTAWKFSESFTVEASVVTPLDRLPSVKGSIGESNVTYSTVLIESTEALFGPRLAMAISEGLYFLLFIAGCLAVMLICRRLWKDRPFTRVAHWTLLGLGALAIITSIASPWLIGTADVMALRELGFPTNGTEVANPDTDEWVSAYAVYDITNINHSLLGLGAVLALTSLAFRQGNRLQDDNDGLV